jgi:hypothetical protein
MSTHERCSQSKPQDENCSGLGGNKEGVLSLKVRSHLAVEVRNRKENRVYRLANKTEQWSPFAFLGPWTIGRNFTFTGCLVISRLAGLQSGCIVHAVRFMTRDFH